MFLNFVMYRSPSLGKSSFRFSSSWVQDYFYFLKTWARTKLKSCFRSGNPFLSKRGPTPGLCQVSSIFFRSGQIDFYFFAASHVGFHYFGLGFDSFELTDFSKRMSKMFFSDEKSHLYIYTLLPLTS